MEYLLADNLDCVPVVGNFGLVVVRCKLVVEVLVLAGYGVLVVVVLEVPGNYLLGTLEVLMVVVCTDNLDLVAVHVGILDLAVVPGKILVLVAVGSFLD